MAKQRTFKTKKKLSATRAVYRPWRDWEVGDILIGTYKGSQIDNYEKPNWLFEVEDAQFTNKKDAKRVMGQVVGLNSCGKLDAAMQTKDGEPKVDVGQIVQIEYKGTSEIEKGKFKGKEAHDVEVEIVEEVDPDDDEELDEDEEETDDEENEEEEDDL